MFINWFYKFYPSSREPKEGSIPTENFDYDSGTIYARTHLIKKPTRCKECPYHIALKKYDYNQVCCSIDHRVCEDERPIWCPLVDLNN